MNEVKGYFNMFDNKRFATRGINARVPLSIQIIIWQMIDDLRMTKKKIDYLQTFKVESSDRYLKIVQSSSEPEFESIFEFPVGSVEMGEIKHYYTVWVMDDGSYSVMMFPEER